MTHSDISINGNSHSSHNVFFVFVLDGFFFFLQFTNRVKTTKLNLKLLHFKRDSHIYNDLKNLNQTYHFDTIKQQVQRNIFDLVCYDFFAYLSFAGFLIILTKISFKKIKW